MRRERGSVKKFYPQIKEMHLQGMSAQEIGDALGLERRTINNTISLMGLQKKRKKLEEKNLVYAENKKPVFERLTINGKNYIDVAPLYIPR